MVVNLLATAVMALSVSMVARDFRALARDVAQSVRSGVNHVRRGGRLMPNLAFGCLWIMIFSLSYG